MRSVDRQAKDQVDRDLLAAYQDVPPGWYRDPDYPALARYWDGLALGTERRRVTGTRKQAPVPTTPSLRPALPAWYPDPADFSSMRYWDGSRWTDQTHALDAPSSAAATPAVAPERRAVTSARAKVITAAAAVLGALAVVGAMTYVDKKPVELSTNTSPSATNASPDPKTVAAPCPHGAPLTTVSISPALQPGTTDTWDVTLSGTLTNDTSTNVQPFYAAVQLLGANGVVLSDPFLLASGGGVDLGPGQSFAVSGQSSVTSTTAPTLGTVSTYWTWFDVDDGACPSNP